MLENTSAYNTNDHSVTLRLLVDSVYPGSERSTFLQSVNCQLQVISTKASIPPAEMFPGKVEENEIPRLPACLVVSTQDATISFITRMSVFSQ